MTRWSRRDFGAGSVEIAQRLIGSTLVRILDDGERLSGMIVETEAYLGVEDAAAHSFGGRRTARNEAMYAVGGTAYVYFTYGMHHCVNVVCGGIDEPVAVLIRALEPMEGMERDWRRLKWRKKRGVLRVTCRRSPDHAATGRSATSGSASRRRVVLKSRLPRISSIGWHASCSVVQHTGERLSR